MPPKHYVQHPPPPNVQQLQQQQPVPVPTISDWIGNLLSFVAKQQGGPFAMALVNHPYMNLPDPVLKTLTHNVENLPPNIPHYYLHQHQQQNVNRAAGGGGVSPTSLQAMYSVLCLYLQAVIVYAKPSPTAPRSRLEAMLNAYSTFEAFHKEDRGAGEAGALLPSPPGATGGTSPHLVTNVGWDTAVLVVLCQKIRALAQVEGALDDGLLSDLIRKWRSMFLFLVSCDKSVANNVARRRGALVVLNCLLAVLFHLGNLHQVKAILSTVDQLESSSGGDPNKGVLGPCGHIKSEVTKMIYYQARVKLYMGLDQQSFSLFAQVCERLPPLSQLISQQQQQQQQQNQNQNASLAIPEVRRNKIRGIFFLCVNAILCGIAPDISSLLQNSDRFTYSIFHPIISAINLGSPTKLEQALNSPVVAPILKTRSVYLQLKQMYLLTIFVAIRRVHAILTELDQENSRIDIGCIAKVAAALDKHACSGCVSRSVGSGNDSRTKETTASITNDDAAPTQAATVDTTITEIHPDSIDEPNHLTLIVDIGQMIQLGWIKGYISFEHQILVLSKKEPFPRRC